MNWVRQLLSSSIGMKFVVALTGLGMAGFLVGHLAGNLLVFAGPEALNAYAKGLHDLGPLLWVARGGLLVCLVLHIYFTLKLRSANSAARPVPYQNKKYTRASFASRTMVVSGLLVFSFIAFHLAHYTFRVTSSDIAVLAKYQVYEMVVLGFQQPLVSTFYMIGLVLLGMHLNHGLSSLFQTLGFNNGKYRPIVSMIGPVFGIGVSFLFITIPVAILLGIVR